jgi:hypothetical protein
MRRIADDYERIAKFVEKNILPLCVEQKPTNGRGSDIHGPIRCAKADRRTHTPNVQHTLAVPYTLAVPHTPPAALQ